MQLINKIKNFLHFKKIHNLKAKINKKEKKLLIKKAPFQKIIGFIDFDNLKIKVNKKVLIPRYETQEVVEFALTKIKENDSILDLGCGSGYIGLTIKAKKPNTKVVCSDISKSAINQTKENAYINKLDIKIIQSSWFKNINQKFDVIISNPPYIKKDYKLDDSVIKFEPKNALFAANDVNKNYKKILKEVDNYLKPNGYLIFEISKDNQKFLEDKGFTILNDINNKPRIAYKTWQIGQK